MLHIHRLHTGISILQDKNLFQVFTDVLQYKVLYSSITEFIWRLIYHGPIEGCHAHNIVRQLDLHRKEEHGLGGELMYHHDRVDAQQNYRQ